MANIHFIGIGGIGMSALAQYFLSQKNRVSGSDIKRSEITDFLKKKGITIRIGHKESNLRKKTDLVIYSNAVDLDNNPEIIKARKLGIKILSYAEALGELTQKFFTIAVSGAHGKSTTVSMLGLAMIEAGLSPILILGTKLAKLGNNNFHLGRSKFLVIEADEYKFAFLSYFPNILIVTNIDKEHLDIYKDLKEIIKVFGKYFNNVKLGGFLLINKNDNNSIAALKHFKKKFKRKDVKILYYDKADLDLKIPGDFNKSNAAAVLLAAKILKIKKSIVKHSLENYKGAWRRMEVLKKDKDKIFISDYAHHPTEIKMTIKALKEFYKDKKIIIVFQAHQLQRLNLLFNDFIKAFNAADSLILMPIFKVAGRESGEFKKDVKDLFLALKRYSVFRKKPLYYVKKIKEVFKILNLNDYKNQSLVVVFMGAGDIDEKIRNYLKIYQ